MNPSARSVLLHDGALSLVVDGPPVHGLERWLPRFPPTGGEAADPAHDAAEIRVGTDGPDPGEAPETRQTFRLASVRAWVDDERERARLVCVTPGCSGSIDLAARRASLHVPARDETGAAAAELFTMLTVTSALLLGRLGRTLVHSAAVVDPAGRAWLLVGDTHAGKTTTTINMVRGGWHFLSDDHVVAGGTGTGGEPWIEGWARPFHVDSGWERGEVTGHREGVEPAEFGADRWRRTAPLGGILFPRVRPDERTGLEPVPPGTALTTLIRQTPWLMADRRAAPGVLTLLQAMVGLPAFALTLGRETYRDADLLLARCAPLLTAHG